MFSKWKYRVRDCQNQTAIKCYTLEEVVKLTAWWGDVGEWHVELLRQGHSVSDGLRFKVDVRGAWSDRTWQLR